MSPDYLVVLICFYLTSFSLGFESTVGLLKLKMLTTKKLNITLCDSLGLTERLITIDQNK